MEGATSRRRCEKKEGFIANGKKFQKTCRRQILQRRLRHVTRGITKKERIFLRKWSRKKTSTADPKWEEKKSSYGPRGSPEKEGGRSSARGEGSTTWKRACIISCHGTRSPTKEKGKTTIGRNLESKPAKRRGDRTGWRGSARVGLSASEVAIKGRRKEGRWCSSGDLGSKGQQRLFRLAGAKNHG